MFCDESTLRVKPGNGGNGAISLRHEKYAARGGPDGGDGGNGGNVILIASHDCNTLSDFRTNRVLEAENGSQGGGKQLHGKNGEDLVLKVPVGTVITQKSDGAFIADLSEEGQELLLARGGRGGYGNAHFTSSTRQTPRFAEKGETTEVEEFSLELKLVADIGIIGFPSVGKSTLISVISNCRPKIAAYPFTTLVPNLGIVKVGEDDFVVADIPGLIEGASEGKGLGDAFLRHIERCSLLLHLIDGTDPNVIQNYEVINSELKKYSETLAQKEQIVAINKSDSFDAEYEKLVVKEFKKKYPKLKIYFISAAMKKGVDELLYHMKDVVMAYRMKQKVVENKVAEEKGTRVVFRPHLEKESADWRVDEIPGTGSKPISKYLITGKRIEQIVNMTDTNNMQGMARLYDVFEKQGILRQLGKLGWTIDLPVHVGKFEVKFFD